MKEDDFFVDLLQDALGLPDDLELGVDARQSLLAAAAASDAGGTVANVVPFQPAPTLERHGFDWLLGEREGSRELFAGLAAAPGLLATLDAERHFMNTLRRSLRQPVEETRRVVRRRPLAAAAAVAALVAIAAIPTWNSARHTPSGTRVAGAAPAPRKVTVQISPAPESGPAMVSLAALPPEPPSRSSASPVSSSAPSASAPLEKALAHLPKESQPGDGCSLAANDASLPVPLNATLLASLDRAQPPEFDPAGPTEAPGKRALAMNDDHNAGYLAGMPLDLRLASQAFSSGKDDDGSGSPGVNEPSIPETGGAMPVMLGFMVLLMHRFRRRLPVAQAPLRS